MIDITLRDHKRNTWIRHQTGVSDIIDVIKRGIHGWAGHIARFKDNRWSKRLTVRTGKEVPPSLDFVQFLDVPRLPHCHSSKSHINNMCSLYSLRLLPRGCRDGTSNNV